MISGDVDVKWIVDPGPSGYDWDAIERFCLWLELWESPCKPSNRYWQLKARTHFWGGHKFNIGLENQQDVKTFQDRWGGFAASGAIRDGRFVTDVVDAWWKPEFWLPCKMRY